MKRFWIHWETGSGNSNAINSNQMRALNSFCDGIGWNIAADVLCAGGSEMDAIAKVEEEAAAEHLPSAKYWIEY